MTLPPDLRNDLLQSIPSMRAFAISLTGNIDQADDLVQEAMVRGLAHINQFQPGTNADSDEAGQLFRRDVGHAFRFQAGHDSDLKSAT